MVQRSGLDLGKYLVPFIPGVGVVYVSHIAFLAWIDYKLYQLNQCVYFFRDVLSDKHRASQVVQGVRVNARELLGSTPG